MIATFSKIAKVLLIIIDTEDIIIRSSKLVSLGKIEKIDCGEK